jgi:hypothetical protein
VVEYPQHCTIYLVTFLEFITPLVCLQGYVDIIYLDVCNDFYIIPREILLHIINNYELPAGSFSWFRTDQTNMSCVRIFGALSSPYVTLSDGNSKVTHGVITFQYFH